jgi:hypothetical protein
MKSNSKPSPFWINVNACAYENLRALTGVGQKLADRIWDLRKQVHIALEDFSAILRLTITPEMLKCVEFGLLVHIDHCYARHFPVYFTAGSLTQNHKNSENQQEIGCIHTEEQLTNISSASKFPNISTSQAEPRRAPFSPTYQE